MRERIQRFLYGRNGSDALSRFLNWTSLLLMLVGSFTLPLFWLLGLALFLYSLFRILSRNRYKRSLENAAFVRIWDSVYEWGRKRKNRFAQRKTHRFFKCPNCKQTVRVPKGKGKITISCPACRTQFVEKT